MCAAQPWMRDAACLGADPNIFFPGRGDNKALLQAQHICQDCPVRTNCLQYALDQPFTLQGVFGGTSERERRRIRLLQNKALRARETQARP